MHRFRVDVTASQFQARRDAKITQIYKGTNQIQRMVLGRPLVK